MANREGVHECKGSMHGREGMCIGGEGDAHNRVGR